jgi:chromosome segregation ATPase
MTDYSELIKRLEGWKHASMRRDGSTLGTMQEAAAAMREMVEERDDARRTSQYWKDEHAAANKENDALRAQVEELRKDAERLQFVLENMDESGFYNLVYPHYTIGSGWTDRLRSIDVAIAEEKKG